MSTIIFNLTGDHVDVELCRLLKLVGLASSGGAGKHLVASGVVRVDGQVETRKTAGIRAGQRVECQGTVIEVQGR